LASFAYGAAAKPVGALNVWGSRPAPPLQPSPKASMTVYEGTRSPNARLKPLPDIACIMSLSTSPTSLYDMPVQQPESTITEPKHSGLKPPNIAWHTAMQSPLKPSELRPSPLPLKRRAWPGTGVPSMVQL